ncbi:MAG: hypothetical protein EXS13_11810 [Planctomycetes bacterium]|nr:hypothetical protein [Planctomycetota bacterium]
MVGPSSARSRFDHCTFEFNRAVGSGVFPNNPVYGGAVYVDRVDLEFDGCRFSGNSAVPPGFESSGGAAVWIHDNSSGARVRCQFLNCEIVNNDSGSRPGGAVTAVPTSAPIELRFVNCTIAGNRSVIASYVNYYPGASTEFKANLNASSGGIAVRALVTTTIENCVLFANSRVLQQFDTSNGNFGPAYTLTDEADQVFWGTDTDASIPQVTAFSHDGLVWFWTNLTNIVPKRTLIDELSEWSGSGNLGGDPLFNNLASGDVRLGSGSPCIDAGTNFADANLFTAGLQPLPAVDFDLDPRIVDGDLDGSLDVDLGAYERQP